MPKPVACLECGAMVEPIESDQPRRPLKDWRPRNEHQCLHPPWYNCEHFTAALISLAWGGSTKACALWCDACGEPFPPGEPGSRQNEEGAGFCAACSKELNTKPFDVC
jgi:hypothetical protein